MSNQSHIEVLLAARQVANFADKHGAQSSAYNRRRATYTHMGAVLADSALQSGLNYNSVVRPRVERIINAFPEADRVDHLVLLVRRQKTSELLDWRHPTKQRRFEDIVMFCDAHGVNDVEDLKSRLIQEDFCEEIQTINGIGPKTVDYMARLVGIDSVAVDRHIRNFAARVGIMQEDYVFLKRAFCFAADLLSISRRDFDAWVWSQESQRRTPQLEFGF